MPRKLWLQKVDWDEELSDVINKDWRSYISDCKQLKKLNITRYLGRFFQVHRFYDALMNTYATIIHLKTINGINEAQVQLLTSKSRVSPLKVQIRTPRSGTII